MVSFTNACLRSGLLDFLVPKEVKELTILTKKLHTKVDDLTTEWEQWVKDNDKITDQDKKTSDKQTKQLDELTDQFDDFSDRLDDLADQFDELVDRIDHGS